MQRRERTHHLIELGGLVQKAGLVDLTDDDRATLYGAMLDLAIAGTPYSLLVGDASAPRGTGSYCSGSISFILFKKGLFVPPAN